MTITHLCSVKGTDDVINDVKLSNIRRMRENGYLECYVCDWTFATISKGEIDPFCREKSLCSHFSQVPANDDVINDVKFGTRGESETIISVGSM